MTSRARSLPGSLLLSTIASACVIPISSTTVPTDSGDAADGAILRDGEAVDGPHGPPPGDASADGPSGAWTNATANLANLPSQCGNLAGLFAKPDEDLLIAGVALDGLWASRDGGGSWTPMGKGAGSDKITNRPVSLAFDPVIPHRYWESGLYNSGGVYETTDDGSTFVQLGNVMSIDLVSVDFSDPNRQTLLAGGHEASQLVWRSTDGGMTWSNVGGPLPPNTACSFPLVITSQTHLVGCDGFGGGAVGVYRTTDGGMTWTMATRSGGGSAPLQTSDGTIYWASPNGQGMTRSTDKGQTWKDTIGSNVISSGHPIELPDGRLATLGPQNQPQYVLVSSDRGASWRQVSTALPIPFVVGLAYSAAHKAFFVWDFSCNVQTDAGLDSVPTNAIARYPFDYMTQ